MLTRKRGGEETASCLSCSLSIENTEACTYCIANDNLCKAVSLWIRDMMLQLLICIKIPNRLVLHLRELQLSAMQYAKAEGADAEETARAR